MKKRCWFAIGLISMFLTLASPLHAQSEGVLRGRVTARSDGSVLPGTMLRLECAAMPGPLQAVTNVSGDYSFLNLIPGRCQLKATHSGFADETLQLLLKPRDVLNADVQLSLVTLAQAIEVNAAAPLLDDSYSPSSTTLQNDQIERLPLTQRNNLPDMIVMAAPGMIRSHDDFVHVRGNEIALNTFINGVSFWENPHSVLSAGLSPNIIQSVSVLTGNFPAEFGNRFGGIVDIVTKSGFSQKNGGTLSVGAGSALRHNAAIEYGGHDGKLAYYVYASAFESARFLSPNDPRSIHDTGRGSHSFLQLDWNANPSNQVKLVVMADGTNFQIPKTSLDDQVRPNDDANQHTRAFSAVLSWNRTISANTQIVTSFYQRTSTSRLAAADAPLSAAAANDQRLITTGLKSDLTRIIGRHTLKTGVDFVVLAPRETLSYNNEGFVAFSAMQGLPDVDFQSPDGEALTFSGRKTGGQASGYIQDTIRLGQNFTAGLGLRLDRYSLAMSETQLSPRLNAAYRFSGGTVLHASYNHFFVPPAVENILVSSAGLTRFLEGNPQGLPALRPIVEDQFEAGVTQPLAQYLHLGVAGYYRSSRHPVHTVLFPDSRVYAYANFDRGKAYGLEFKAGIPLVERLGLSAYLNAALSRVYLWNPVNAGFVEEVHHLEDDERFLAPMNQDRTLNSGFTVRRRNGLWAGMNFEYGSGTPAEAAEGESQSHLPGHFTQNVSLGVDLLRYDNQPRLGLQFNIENLSNNVYKVSQESAFSPGEYFNPRFFSGSITFHF